MHGKIYQKLIIVFLCLLTIGCKKEAGTAPPEISSSKKVYILCEGAYGNGNAALDYYDADSNEYVAGIYQTVNQQSLGDIFQSMTRIGEYFFLCINNSDKIIVVHRKSLQLAATIQVPKPRYILPINDDKAYVSSLFDNKIHIINPKTFTKTGEINMPANNPEGMLIYKNQVIVCCWDTATSFLYFIDTKQDKIVKNMDIFQKAPQSIVADKDDNLWITSGDVYRNVSSTLTKINPQTETVLKSSTYSEAIEFIKPVMNKAKDSIYFIQARYDGSTDHNGIYRMAVNAQQFPTQPFIAAQSFQYFWGLGIDPENGEIYIADPKSFNQKGHVIVYQPNGKKIKEWTTSVGPNGFYFDY